MTVAADAGVDVHAGGRATMASDEDTAEEDDCDLPLDLSCRASSTDVESSSLVAAQHRSDLQLDFDASYASPNSWTCVTF